jgi:putative aminopeptidase FrvX
MDRRRLMAVAREIFLTPTAPFHEHRILDIVRRFVRTRKALSMREDRHGNIVVRYRRGAPGRGALLAFGAHTDHPGMEITGAAGKNLVNAIYLGGGPREKLVGARVRIFSRNADRIDGVKARVVSIKAITRWKLTAVLRLSAADAARVRPGDFTMYDFPPLAVKKGMLFTRGCDDVGSVAGLLAFLDELIRRRVKVEVIAFFTRAEEAGFNGAVTMAKEQVLPRRAKIITLETSSALHAGAIIGGGPCVRVGDYASIFDPRVCLFLDEVCRGLAKKEKKFLWQRKLMGGGICETTIFSSAGYAAGGLAVPLGNYHNVGVDGRAHPEFISLADLDGLVEILLACVARCGEFESVNAGQVKKFNDLYAKSAKRLRETL